MLASVFSVFCAVFGGPIRLIMFVSGILLYEAGSNKGVSAPSSAFGLLTLCVGLLATLLPVTGSGGAVVKIIILFVSFFVLCFSCFGNPTTWLPRGFSWTPLRWLGNMSYSYYLLHGLALKAGFLVLTKTFPAAGGSNPLWFWMLLPIMFGLTLIPTTILFLAIERPLSLVRKNAMESRRTGREEAVAQASVLPK